jgi:precorrin-3B synthase
MNAAVEIKGWCPGALRPMPSGDGLIVRIRPSCGALSLEQASSLARLAQSLGNGHIDLTRRANLQLRGLGEERLAELHGELRRLSLLDHDAETEARLNVMVSPLAGLDPAEHFDVRPIARALDRALSVDASLQALPAKFGFLVDGGGTLSIAGERADICLAATGETIAFGLDTASGTAWLGSLPPDRAAETALVAARAFLAAGGPGRMRAHGTRVKHEILPLLDAVQEVPAGGARHLGLLPTAVGIAAPFGRLTASQLLRLVSFAERAGASELRVSPWRSLYIGVRNETLLESARAIGLIVDQRDPLLQVEACPGAPDCRSSTVDARNDARLLSGLAAASGYAGGIHVSGCAKKCARSSPSDLTLVGEDGRYRLGTRIVERSDFPHLLESLVHG